MMINAIQCVYIHKLLIKTYISIDNGGPKLHYLLYIYLKYSIENNFLCVNQINLFIFNNIQNY